MSKSTKIQLPAWLVLSLLLAPSGGANASEKGGTHEKTTFSVEVDADDPDEIEEKLKQAVEGVGHVHRDAHGAPLGFKTDLAIWSLVVFLIFIFVLQKFAWGPLSAGLDKREGRIRQDIADAESARIKAEQMLAAHQQQLEKVQDEVKEILAEARKDAEQARQNIAETAKAEADATKQRAIIEIERARDQALNELFDVMAGQVATATEYVLGEGLKPDDQDKLIQQALAQIGSESN